MYPYLQGNRVNPLQASWWIYKNILTEEFKGWVVTQHGRDTLDLIFMGSLTNVFTDLSMTLSKTQKKVGNAKKFWKH